MVSPRARISAITTSMPFLSIVRSPCCETRRPTQRFSLSTQKRRYCRFGRNRRWVLLLAWETWLPCCGFLPVTSHTRAMMQLQNSEKARFYTNSGFCPTMQRLDQPALGERQYPAACDDEMIEHAHVD